MCGNGTKNARLLETPATWEAYADGVASLEIHGPNARITYFAFRTMDGEQVKMPVAEVVLPASVCESGVVGRMMKRARAKGRATAEEEVPATSH